MAGDQQRGALFRPLVPNQHSRVTYAELFFDLVFAFAVTQISHTLLGRFTPLGTLQTTLLFCLMLGGLVLSTSIPKAFESRGLWFALAYSAMQVGRTVFLLASTAPGQTTARLNAWRILAWLSVSAVFWISGGFAQGQPRLVLWAIALAIEYV